MDSIQILEERRVNVLHGGVRDLLQMSIEFRVDLINLP